MGAFSFADEGLPPADHGDSYVEDGLLVYTAAYHVKRGQCCGSGCRHCPYEPRHVAGTVTLRDPRPGAAEQPRIPLTGRDASG